MNLNTRILTVAILASLSACKSIEKKVDEPSLEPTAEKAAAPLARPDLAYKVRPGDFLSSIAQKTTGDGANWRAIAAYNNIKNPNKLKRNDTIMIPSALLPVEKRTSVVVEVPAKPRPKQQAAKVEPPKKPAKSTNTKENSSGWVMVEGSYYPKAVYKEPNYSGGMLTRVLPGTTLKHIKSSENWIAVETDKGLGYLHRTDARRLSRNELSLNSSIDY